MAVIAPNGRECQLCPGSHSAVRTPRELRGRSRPDHRAGPQAPPRAVGAVTGEWARGPPSPPPLQEVLTATLDLEDVRSYRAEMSSRNLAVRGRLAGRWPKTQKLFFFKNHSFIEVSSPQFAYVLCSHRHHQC